MNPSAPQRRPGHLTRPALGMLLALALLLVPVGYLFVVAWSTNATSQSVVATERAAVAYGRPLNDLMAALVEGRSTAVERITVDDSAIQAAMREINKIDRRSAELLSTEQRWNQLSKEINSTLSRNASGVEALRAYATPIALTREMLDWIGDTSQAIQDPAASYHLLEVALHKMPDAVAAAGELAATAASGDNKTAHQIQLGVAEQRLKDVVGELAITLRAATEHRSEPHFSTDLNVLKPLDQLSAAADELTTAADDLTGSGATGVALVLIRDRIDVASTKLRTAAVVLANALFDEFDAQLRAASSSYAKQRWLLISVAALIAAAVAILMWLRYPWPPRRRAPQAETDRTGRHGRQEGVERPETNLADARLGDARLVDARELLTRESADIGRAVGARKR